MMIDADQYEEAYEEAAVKQAAKESGKTEEEIREWMEAHNVSITDVVRREIEQTFDSEDKLVQQAVNRVVETCGDDIRNLRGSEVYAVCCDVGIRYKTDDVYEEARNQLQEDNDS